MKRFPFKRHLVILVTCLLAIGVIVPVAAFAKSASGEPHHPTPSIKDVAQVASGVTSFNVTTDADCHVSADSVVSFHTGDTVSGTAELVTTFGDPTEEAGENEPLVLGGTNVPSIPGNPFAVDTGSHSFSFIAAGDGTLTACVDGNDGGDGDESGTITGTVVTPTPTSVTFKAPFAISNSTHFHTPIPSSAGRAICEGLSGVPNIQTNKSTGAVGYSAFAWGGFCSFFDAFVPAKDNPPAQEASVESLMGDVFTAPVSGTYRISADITLHGNGSARAGANAFDIIQSFVPGKAGKILDLLGLLKLTNPANLLPSVASARDALVLKIESTQSSSSKGFPNLAVDSVLHDSQDEVFSGTHTVTMTIHLNAGQQVLILGGMSTDIKAWGNASAIIKTFNSKVDQIVVQLI